MAPPRQRFSKPPTSRRYLALRHGREVIQRLQANGCDPHPQKSLPDGYKRLYSYNIPGLTAGIHEISVSQSISADTPTDPKKPDLKADVPVQKFDVLAPRFELPEDAVYSVYPEQGNSATHDVLPHMVFNDHMLPWERIGSVDAEEKHPDDYDSNRVPWLACVAFTADELTLSKEEMAKVFSQTSIKDTATQSDTFSTAVPMDDILKLSGSTVKTPFTDTSQATKATTDVIFPPAWLFNGLFAAYDADNKQKASPTGGPDISRHRFLAHVIQINPTGMANADRNEEQKTREFSAVVSNRVGPLMSKDGKPQQMFVHLVSLEGVEKHMGQFPIALDGLPGKTIRVGLNSLYSWSYMCLPPESLNVKEAFDHIAKGASMLRADLSTIKAPQGADQEITARVLNRLLDGFTLVRNRLQTGEQTASLLRGALTPNLIPPTGWDLLSDSGASLAILDKELGMMDITYSSAWSLGRTLALADRAYTISLTRLRRDILARAGDSAKSQVVRATGRPHFDRHELLAALEKSIGELVDMSKISGSQTSSSSARQRWTQPAAKLPEISLQSSGMSHILDTAALDEAAYLIASSTSPKPDWWKLPYTPPYDEFNTPYSTDWMVVLRFLLDLYYLVNVPSHYLLTDNSHLPEESIRMFFVDHNWVDALVDGALSLGNHGELGDDVENGTPKKDDPVRRSIKKAVQRYFDSPNSRKYTPPVPRFGFYIRSAVVALFPDLKVSAYPELDKDAAPMLLRHDIIDRGVMIGLFSDEPVKTGLLQGLRFEVPAHQQYFSAGDIITTDLFNALYRRQYTVEDPNDTARNQNIAAVQWSRADGGKGKRVDNKDPDDVRVRDPAFIWGNGSGTTEIRMLQVDKLADDVYSTLHVEMRKLNPAWFTEERATSAMAGIQLTNPAWQLQLGSMPALFAHAQGFEQISSALSYREKRNVVRDLESLETAKLPAKAPARRLPTLAERSQMPGIEVNAAAPYHQRVVDYTSTRHSRETGKSTLVWSSKRKNSMSMSSSSDGLVTPTSQWSEVNSPDMAAQLQDPSGEVDFASIPLEPPLITEPSYMLASSGLPRFDYNISATTALQSKDSTIPLVSTRQDLVFSIIYVGQGSGFFLQSFSINIPAVTSLDRKNLMLTLPAGVGARMLSNLRFNVRTTYSTEKRALILIIEPRSRSGSVLMSNWIGKYSDGHVDTADDDGWEAPVTENPLIERTELSVILTGVHVNTTQGEIDCKVVFEPLYTNTLSDPKDVYALLRKPVGA